MALLKEAEITPKQLENKTFMQKLVDQAKRVTALNKGHEALEIVGTNIGQSLAEITPNLGFM